VLTPSEKPETLRDVRIIGLTGGTGSGKSETARVFVHHGLPVLNADRIGHELLGVGGPAVDALVQSFGQDVLTNGAINRAALAEKVFGDAEALAELNAVMHPLISERILRRCEALVEKGYRLVVLDAALLCEDGAKEAFLDGLVVVDSPEETRIQRLMEHRGWSREEAQRRVQSQTDPQVKRPLADWILENNGSLEELREQAADLAKELTEKDRVPLI
jgi:dephospho-CoA kinase